MSKSGSTKPPSSSSSSMAAGAGVGAGDGGAAFLSGSAAEDGDLNQYWYSPLTIRALVDEVLRLLRMPGAPEGAPRRVAFLSTPSLYFSMPEPERRNHNAVVLDFDRQWEADPGYFFYDFHHPEDLPLSAAAEAPRSRTREDLPRGGFDVVVVDPPFITHEVWRKYAEAAHLLLRKKGSVILTTVLENRDLLHELFGARPQMFQPSIPHLVYQYHVFANYDHGESSSLAHRNPEIPLDD